MKINGNKQADSRGFYLIKEDSLPVEEQLHTFPASALQKEDERLDPLTRLDQLIQDRLYNISAPKDKVSTWRKSWDSLRKQVLSNELMPVFSPHFETRKQQYDSCLQSLYDSLLFLIQKKEDEAFFDLELPELIGVCYTGWKEHLSQIKARAELGLIVPTNLFSLAHKTAASLCEEVLKTKVLPAALQKAGVTQDNLSYELGHVHNHVILKQWAQNNHYPTLSLVEEEEPMYPFRAPYLDSIGPAILREHYNEASIIQALQTTYNDLDDISKGRLWHEIEKAYTAALLQKKTPYIDPLTKVEDLYLKMKELTQLSQFIEFSLGLKKLHSLFIEEGFTPPFSAETPKEMARTKLMATPIRLAVLQGKDLLQYTEKNPVLTQKEKNAIYPLITALAKSEEKEHLETYVRQKKQALLALFQNKEKHIATLNARLFKELFEDPTGKLLPFGALFWASMTYLIKSPSRQTPLKQQLLDFAISAPHFISSSPSYPRHASFYSPSFSLQPSKFSMRTKKKNKLKSAPQPEFFIKPYRKKKRKKRHSALLQLLPPHEVQLEFLV